MPEFTPLSTNPTASREEEEVFLRTALRSTHRDQHSVFLPSTSFYNHLSTDQGLTEAGLEICRWIGIKPHRLGASYSNQIATNPHVIFIHPNLQMLPYHAGLALSMAVIRLLLEQKHFGTDFNKSLIEHATIILGFQVIVLNAVSYKETTPEHWHRLVKHHHISLPQTLTTYSKQSYAEASALYCTRQEIDLKAALPYLHKHALALLPQEVLTIKSKQPHAPKGILQRRRQANKALLGYFSLSLFIGIVLASGAYLWVQRPKELPPTLLESQQKLSQLEQSYAECTKEARQQINNYEGDDIFVERRIDEMLTRCQSIKNQYTYEALQYNQILEDIR